ncbi:MAG: FAD-binding oxidoreductase [bacterium]|nr:FAD-binding oxidoreductase [bacterium]
MQFQNPGEDRHSAGLRACLTRGVLYTRADIESANANAHFSEDEFLEYGRDRTRVTAPDFSVLVFPETTDEVAALIRYCYEQRLAVTASGGRTGLSGGAVAAHGEVVLSLSRMNRLIDFDPYLPALHVEAGMITAVAQEHAREHGCQFPLDLAASGSSQVGGNIATNAGGTRMISVGGLRDYVTGLTVVTGTGEILTFPGHILKNNSGFDLRSLFIGSEGCLGIITEAVIRLPPAPRTEATALFAVPDLAAALRLLTIVRSGGVRPLTFEYFDAASLQIVRQHLNLRAPFAAADYPGYVIMSWDESDQSMDAALEIFSSDAVASLALDVRVAGNSSQAAELWKFREGISESIALEARAVHKHDVSVPAAAMSEFVAEATKFLTAGFAGVRMLVFGHLGDGNLHLNFIPDDSEAGGADSGLESFRESLPALDAELFSRIARAGGSISAEHGIGLLKKKYLHYSRSQAEIQLMRGIKAVLDPGGILNPGKVLPAANE